MRAYYQPESYDIPASSLTVKQREYLANANARWNIAVGATRSGKSFIGYRILIANRVLNAKGVGLLCLIGNSLGTLNRNILEPMRKYYPGCVGEVRLADSSVIMFGKKVFLIGADRVDRVAMIQGTGIEYAYGDEITTWNEEFFQMLKSRLDTPDSRFDGTCNPDNPNHWFKEFIDGIQNSTDPLVKASMYYQHYTIDDNPALDPTFVHTLKEQYRGTVFYHRFILGEWKRAEGLIYQDFSEDKHVFYLDGYIPFMRWTKMQREGATDTGAIRMDTDEIHNTPYKNAQHLFNSVKRIRFACDIGHSNATAYLAIGEMADGRLYALDEFYHSGKKMHQTWSPTKYALKFIEFYNYVMKMFPMAVYGGTYIDPSAIGFMAELQQHGMYSIHSADNDVIGGIQFVSNMIAGDKFRVSRACKNLLNEIFTYSWDEKLSSKGIDAPIKVNDHCLDAGRYLIYSLRSTYTYMTPLRSV